MKLKKLLIFANDPLKEYYKKGELVDRYFNPCDFFDEVYFISLTKEEIEEEKIKYIVGKAKVKIFSIGKVNPWILSPFSTIKRKILKIAKEIQPSCIRVYNAHVHGLLGAIVSNRLDIPLVVSLHINPEKDIRAFLSPFGNPFRWIFWNLNKYIIEPFVLSRASRIICAYNFIYNFAENLCDDPKKIEVIYNRIDMDRFKLINKSNKKNGTVKILYVGRLFKSKNPEYLIKAMPNIDAELTIIGDGSYRWKMQSIIESLNLTNKVFIITSVPNKEIHGYYQESDIFVSVNNYGGISKVVIEAMASGLPIVMNKPLWEPFPELIEDTAVVAENSPDGFTKALQQLIQNPTLMIDLGRKNREKALRIDGRIMEQREMEIYRSLVDKK